MHTKNSLTAPVVCVCVCALTGAPQASISIRKGKKLVFFELTVKCGWEGEMIDGEGDVIASTDGLVQFTGLDQDNWNSPDDLDVRLLLVCGAYISMTFVL